VVAADVADPWAVVVAELLRVPPGGILSSIERVYAFAGPIMTGSLLWCRIDSDRGEQNQQREGDDGLEVHFGW